MTQETKDLLRSFMSNFLLYFGGCCLANDFFQVAGVFETDSKQNYIAALSVSAAHLIQTRASRKKRDGLILVGYDAAAAEAKVTQDEAREREKNRFGRMEWTVAVCGAVVGLFYKYSIADKTGMLDGAFLGFGAGCFGAMMCRSFWSGVKEGSEDSSKNVTPSK